MSLINDALKRARQAQQQNPFDGQPVVPLQPVDYAARPNRILRALIGLALLASLALSGWFFIQWWRGARSAPQPNAVARQSVSTGERPAPERPVAGRAAPERPGAAASDTTAPPDRRRQAIQVSTNLVVRTNFAPLRPRPPAGAPSQPSQPSSTETVAPPANATAPTNAAPAGGAPEQAATAPSPGPAPAPPAGPFADLKLQSIILREDKPAAVINGDMVFVGDRIRGARVVTIEHQTVTVERGGETNELRLPRL